MCMVDKFENSKPCNQSKETLSVSWMRYERLVINCVHVHDYVLKSNLISTSKFYTKTD